MPFSSTNLLIKLTLGHLYAKRFKVAVLLRDKTSASTAVFFIKFKVVTLGYPSILLEDRGKEFYIDITKLMDEYHVIIHRSHALTSIIERFNQTLAKALYGFQYKKNLDVGK